MKNIIVLLTLLCFNAYSMVPKAIELQVTPKGVDALLDTAKVLGQGKIQKLDLGALNFDIPLLGNIKMEKAKISLNFSKFALSPIQDALKGTIQFSNLTLDIEKFTLTKKITKHKRICKNTSLKLINDFDLHLNLSLQKQGENLAVGLNEFKTELKKNNVSSDGPEGCFNDRGNKRRFMKWITHKIINSPKIINFALKSASSILVTELQKEINKQINPLSIPVTIPKLEFLEERKLLITGKINDLSITSGGIKLILDADVQNGSDKANTRRPRIIRYARAKINPELINTFIKAYLGNRAPGKILEWHKLNAVYSFLPEIENLKTTSDQVKLLVSFGDFNFSIPQNNKLDVSIKDFTFLLETEVDNEYKEYFRFAIHSDFTLSPKIEEGKYRKLRLNSTIHSFNLEGSFADGREVTSANFKREALEAGIYDLFKTLLDDDSTLYSPIQIPNFEIAKDMKMTLHRLGIRDGSLFGELSSAK